MNLEHQIVERCLAKKDKAVSTGYHLWLRQRGMITEDQSVKREFIPHSFEIQETKVNLTEYPVSGRTYVLVNTCHCLFGSSNIDEVGGSLVFVLQEN